MPSGYAEIAEPPYAAKFIAGIAIALSPASNMPIGGLPMSYAAKVDFAGPDAAEIRTIRRRAILASRDRQLLRMFDFTIMTAISWRDLPRVLSVGVGCSAPLARLPRRF